jgi:hypothetical protein
MAEKTKEAKRNKHLSKPQLDKLCEDLRKTFAQHGIHRLHWTISLPLEDGKGYAFLQRSICITLPEKLAFLSGTIQEAKEDIEATTKSLLENSITKP